MSLLQSERIQLIPLTPEQVPLLISDQQSLEMSLGLNHNTIDLDNSWIEEMRRALTDYTIPKLKENPVEYKWFTSWLIVHLADNVYIGALGANGLPDEKGEVIIGYFVERKYDGQGFATEATGLFANHLLQDNRLKQVAATIPIGHSASEKVVEKNGFIIESQLEEEGIQLNKWVLRKEGV